METNEKRADLHTNYSIKRGNSLFLSHTYMKFISYLKTQKTGIPQGTTKAGPSY